ncbi:unnamed protein product [Gadus morhua 'NCC']
MLRSKPKVKWSVLQSFGAGVVYCKLISCFEKHSMSPLPPLLFHCWGYLPTCSYLAVANTLIYLSTCHYLALVTTWIYLSTCHYLAVAATWIYLSTSCYLALVTTD